MHACRWMEPTSEPAACANGRAEDTRCRTHTHMRIHALADGVIQCESCHALPQGYHEEGHASIHAVACSHHLTARLHGETHSVGGRELPEHKVMQASKLSAEACRHVRSGDCCMNAAREKNNKTKPQGATRCSPPYLQHICAAGVLATDLVDPKDCANCNRQE
jgi:hypothetical protein